MKIVDILYILSKFYGASSGEKREISNIQADVSSWKNGTTHTFLS